LDDLRTILDQLEDKRLDYVQARSRVNSDAAAIRECGMSKTAYYNWPEDERKRLNEIAQMFKRETAARALMVLQDAAVQAAEVKVSGLKDRDSRVKQSAASEILDRTVGKATEKIDVTSGGEKIKGYIGIDPDDWDKPDAEK